MSVRFQRTPARWGLLPLVVAGGVIGAFARGLLTMPFPRPLDAMPAVMAINVAGSFLLALLVGWVGASPRLRAFLGAGVLGGFTSYSAIAPWLAVEGGNLFGAAAQGHIATVVLGALAVIAVAVAMPVAAAAGGFAVGRRLAAGDWR